MVINKYTHFFRLKCVKYLIITYIGNELVVKIKIINNGM